MLNAVLVDAVMMQELEQWQQDSQSMYIILQVQQAVSENMCSVIVRKCKY